MGTITDFDEWLEFIDLSDFNDVYSLYRTVEDLSNWGSFSIEEGSENKYFLKSSECDKTLMLASEKARTAFLKKIESDHCGDLDIESYYSFRHAMEKDD